MSAPVTADVPKHAPPTSRGGPKQTQPNHPFNFGQNARPAQIKTNLACVKVLIYYRVCVTAFLCGIILWLSVKCLPGQLPWWKTFPQDHLHVSKAKHESGGPAPRICVHLSKQSVLNFALYSAQIHSDTRMCHQRSHYAQKYNHMYVFGAMIGSADMAEVSWQYVTAMAWEDKWTSLYQTNRRHLKGICGWLAWMKCPDSVAFLSHSPKLDRSDIIAAAEDNSHLNQEVYCAKKNASPTFMSSRIFFPYIDSAASAYDSRHYKHTEHCTIFSFPKLPRDYV